MATAALVLVVAVGVAWSRIDSTNNTASRLSGQVIVAATSRADTARFDTIIEIGSGKNRVGGEVSGSVDFTNQLGDETIRALPAASTSTPSSAGSASSEVRWIGDDYYTSAASEGAASGPSWTLVNAAKVHAASSCLAKLDVAALVSGFGGVNPSDLLDTLRRQGTDFERVGTDTLDGVTTTRWHAAPTGPFLKLCNSGDNIARTNGRETLDIYTDGQNRARRVSDSETGTTTLPDSKPYTQTIAETTDFSDFGAPVVVQAPPADQTTDQTETFIAEQLGPGSVHKSSWHQGAHGTFNGSPWKIDTARTTTGWNCYDLTDTPNNSGVPEGGTTNGFPEHDGHSTECQLAGQPELGISGPVGLFINSTGTSQRLIVGAVNGTGATTLAFQDGSVQHLEVDPNTLIFNWSGPASRVPVRIRVGGQSCRVDNQDQPDQPNWALNTNSSCQQWAP
ncbi:MAG: hypothetical protein ACLPVY_03185 [Acidimicrobiia bacterium]